ncbi:hypothetical protein K501DRAFT_302653 [Backusella circina FSU 941]|nr:hypothetical protein K501DRAFT_302653 [Backusella circina FSU 941]
MAAKDNSTTSNISGITIVSAKQNTSLFASPDILVNGTLFYSALSITCLLWVTGRFIDYKTDRLERFTEANVHKL